MNKHTITLCDMINTLYINTNDNQQTIDEINHIINNCNEIKKTLYIKNIKTINNNIRHLINDNYILLNSSLIKK